MNDNIPSFMLKCAAAGGAGAGLDWRRAICRPTRSLGQCLDQFRSLPQH
jgi:hypothetical protein